MTPTLGLVRAGLGDEFTAYALATTVADLDDLDLTPPRLAAIETLAAYTTPPLLNGDVINWDFAYVLTRDRVATATHLACGGEPPTFSTDDQILAVLERCVWEAFPLLLLPPGEAGPVPTFPILPTGVAGAAREVAPIRELERLFLEDPDLRQLFLSPDDADSRGDLSDHDRSRIVASHFWASGVAPAAYLGLTAGNLVSFPLVMAAITNEITVAAVLGHAREGLLTARRLARGEKAEVPYIVTFSDWRLADGVPSIDTPWGPLTNLSPLASAMLRSTGLYNLDGQHRPPSLALVTSVRDRSALSLRGPWDPPEGDAWSKKVSAAIAALQAEAGSRVTRLRYSMLLASSDEEYLVPRALSYFSGNPLGAFPSIPPADPASASIKRGSGQIGRDTADEISMWSHQVVDRHPASLNVGMRRLLFAATRNDPLDGFIDAVMCWENLFSGTPETAFKVCGAMAFLLEPDSDSRRKDLYVELKRLYQSRSTLVHGGREPDPATAIHDRVLAIDLARAAMRAAYGIPGLMELKGASARHEWMLLGFPVS